MIRDNFPMIKHPPYSPFCYLDNAATTQVPQVVIDAIGDYYKTVHANVHRAPYRLAEVATAKYEELRSLLAERYDVTSDHVVLTHGATEGLNLLAYSLSQTLKEGDGILLSYLEHHSAIVPWQIAAQSRGLEIFWAPLSDQGVIDCEKVKDIICANPNIKIMSVCGASNVLGTYQPLQELSHIAKAHQILMIVDACQMGLENTSIPMIGCDFWVLSAHKMFGPTGIGCVIASDSEQWNKLPPFHTGGGMISMVTTTHSLFQEGPRKFEAGTPSLVSAYGWAASLRFIAKNNVFSVQEHFYPLIEYAQKSLNALEGYKLLAADNKNRCGVFSVVHEKLHPHDLATYLDHVHGILVRAGHHCAMPLMDYLGVGSTLRISLSWYNTRQEIDHCIDAMKKAQDFFNV